jgi:hypothetical protein
MYGKPYNKLVATAPNRWGQVFGCAFLFAEEDPTITYWLLWFFNSYFVTISTNPSDKDGVSIHNPYN